MEKMGTSERKGGIIKKEERGKCVCVCVCLCACVGGGVYAAILHVHLNTL